MSSTSFTQRPARKLTESKARRIFSVKDCLDKLQNAKACLASELVADHDEHYKVQSRSCTNTQKDRNLSRLFQQALEDTNSPAWAESIRSFLKPLDRKIEDHEGERWARELTYRQTRAQKVAMITKIDRTVATVQRGLANLGEDVIPATRSGPIEDEYDPMDIYPDRNHAHVEDDIVGNPVEGFVIKSLADLDFWLEMRRGHWLEWQAKKESERNARKNPEQLWACVLGDC